MSDAPLRLRGLTDHGDLVVPPGRPWLIGRGTAADLIVADPSVSRHHAEVEVTPGGLRARDLGSANGTFVNGAAIQEAVLRPGDVLTIGRPAFRLDAPSMSEESPTPGLRTPEVDGSPLGQPDLLARLLGLARTLSGAFSLERLALDIVELAFAVVEADRMALLVPQGAEGTLVPLRSRSRIGEDSAVQVPRAIAGRAASLRTPVITESALDDAVLQSGSVQASRVRSAMAVPLLASDDQLVGVLYADRIARLEPFTDDDAVAMLAFAGLAAVSLAKLQLMESLQRQRDTQRNLERFFAPEVAAAIAAAETPVTAGGQRRTVTVLFSDIRDFTPLAESLPPEDVAALLNEYFTAMADLVFAHGGTLDKFLGDGLLAVWGTPFPLPDASARAIEAALAMRRAVADLNTRWARAGRPTLGVGFGLASGEVFAGRIGSDHRLDYTVIGDPVNVAARLCQAAPAGRILTARAVIEGLAAGESFAPQPEVQVRGRAGAVEVWGG